MKETILKQLTEIEVKHGVKILFAVESGSRAWGFESKDSDYDVRFVYVRPKRWYLKVFEGKDTIDIPVDEVLDLNGWDIKKVLQLMYKSNPPLVEWLTSPVVYRDALNVRELLLEPARQFFSPIGMTYHYVNLARNSMATADGQKIRTKKLFYALRPLFACMWIEHHGTLPPMNFLELKAGVEIDEILWSEIEQIMAEKKFSTEADWIQPSPNLLDWISSKIEHYNTLAGQYRHEKEKNVAMLDETFLKCLELD